MAASPSLFCPLLNIPNSKISATDVGFRRISLFVGRKQFFTNFNPVTTSPISIADSSPSSSSCRCKCNSATIANSLTIDHDSIDDEELKRAEAKSGSKIRVKVPIKVYHVPKVAEYELTGKFGVLKEYVGVYKGKKISPNLPYRVEFEAEEVSGRGGKPLKFVAHLREDEFEFID